MNQQPKPQDYPIQEPFRLNGRWWGLSDKTIALLPQQAVFLQQNGKIGEPVEVKAPSKTSDKEGK
ncbi:TPA: hypothetical protein ACGUPM_002648 [Vibrio vulnificus]